MLPVITLMCRSDRTTADLGAQPCGVCGLSLLHSLLLPAGGLRKSYTTTAVAREREKERKGGHIETKREE